MGHIYKITSPTGKVYIGQSLDAEKRWVSYRSLNCKGQPKIYHSLKKHGPENHLFQIIETCKDDQLLIREKHYIDLYDSYNTGLNSVDGSDKIKVIKPRKEVDNIWTFLFENERELYNDITEVMQARAELHLKTILWHIQSKTQEQVDLKALQTKLQDKRESFLNKYSNGIFITSKIPSHMFKQITQLSISI